MSRRLIIDLTDEHEALLDQWQDCAAFRITDLGDGTARLELTNDLDRITAPEPVDKREKCTHCHGTGKFKDPYGGESRCKYCRGTGRR